MYILDLIGTFAFAVTGAYKAKSNRLNIFGVVALGILTAVGGGTVRDLIIGRTPLFYLEDPNYFLVGILAGLVTYLMPDFFKKTYSLFRFIDSLGLAAFVIIGVSISQNYLFPNQEFITAISFLACIFLGMLTGFGGGILRDGIMGDVPYSFKKGSRYIFSAFWGSASFYLISFINVDLAVAISIIITLYLREISSKFGIYKRVYLNNKK